LAFKGKDEKKAQEPWEAKIYDLDENFETVNKSRVSMRKKNVGNSLFIKLCITLIAILAAVPIVFYFLTIGKDGNKVKVSTKSSASKTSSKSLAADSSSSTSKAEEEAKVTSDSKNNQEDTATVEAQPQPQTSATQFTQVNDGEGLQQIATRTGVSIERIAQLNGITLTPDGSFSPTINPGQKLRIG